MSVYTVIRILHDYVNGKNEELLESTAFFVIPMLNVDGFLKIDKIYQSTE